jgi:glycosyltransferase involved in cell wall biosynthesis
MPDRLVGLRIAILGTRGITATYGGFETLAEELSVRLVARGHDVTVYSRRHQVAREAEQHRGVRVVSLPTVRRKYFETVVHTLVSGLHAANQGYDAVLVCNAVNALTCRLPRLLGSSTRVVLNVDGLERNRRKWNALGKLVYFLSERLSCVIPDAVVTDARAIEEYYRTSFGLVSTFIPYGSDLPTPKGSATLDRLGLRRGAYVLYVSRFEPENNADAVLRGYRDFSRDLPLVLVGSAPYAERFISGLRADAAEDRRVLLPGAIYGEGYRELLANAAAYVHATEVGGTHPALVEAMGFGRPIVAHGTAENREVLGEEAVWFDAAKPETLTVALEKLFRSDEFRLALGERAGRRAAERYRWDTVTDAYERLLGARPPAGLRTATRAYC